MEILQGFIEIGQDAAAVVESGNPEVVGVFTDSIQTCLIAAFECQQGLVVVHDSAQLQFSEISNLVASQGRCKKLTVIYPSHNLTQHAERIERLKRITGVSGSRFIKVSVPYEGYAVKYSPVEGAQVYPHGSVATSVPLPSKAIRTSIAEINNFFIEPNSKSLVLDVQYSDGRYNEVASIQKSEDQLLAIVERQPKFFFNNAALLHAAHQLNLLSIPASLIDRVERNGLAVYRTHGVPDHDRARQSSLYDEFMASRKVPA